jgi:hypothetical protein
VPPFKDQPRTGGRTGAAEAHNSVTANAQQAAVIVGAMDTTQRLRPTQPPVAPAEATSRILGLGLARVAGLLYLAIIACGLFAEVVVRGQLIEANDPTATAANILESPWLFRIGFTADLLMFLCDVALAIVLYQLLKPLDQTLSMLATAFRLTQTAIIGLNVLSMFNALRILDDAGYMSRFGADQIDALALLSLDTHRYGYILGMTFFAISTLIVGYLAWTSRRLPRLLGALLIAAGAGYLVDGLMFFLIPGYDGSASPIVLAPALVGELWFCVWLLTKGSALEALETVGPMTDRSPIGGHA